MSRTSPEYLHVVRPSPRTGSGARWRWHLLIAAATIATVGRGARSQANIPQFRGALGLNAGTQAPPGQYLSLLYNSYHADHMTDGDNLWVPIPTNISAVVLSAEYSSPFTMLGGRWSANVGVPWASGAMATPDVETPWMWGFGDLYVQPLQLGWTLNKADIVVGQGFFAPTGRYRAGATDNTGLGMWSWESSLGGTLYLGDGRNTTLSTLASYQVQSTVENTNKHAGQVLTLEGGGGQRIHRIHGQIGAVYYARIKTTHDDNFRLPEPLDHKDLYFGLGPEISASIPGRSLTTSFTARLFFEVGNRSAPQGGSLYVIATLSAPHWQRP
jgi:hypothetical protein